MQKNKQYAPYSGNIVFIYIFVQQKSASQYVFWMKYQLGYGILTHLPTVKTKKIFNNFFVWMHEMRQEYVWIVIPPNKLKSKIQSDQFKYM